MTGVYCFDNYVKEVRNQGIKICGQFHDEIAFRQPNTVDKEEIKRVLNSSITKVNERLKLNIKLGISIDFGDNYAEIH